MIGLLFDFLIAGFFVAIVLIVTQFKTGFMINKKLKIWKYIFEIKGVRGESLIYKLWKEEP